MMDQTVEIESNKNTKKKKPNHSIPPLKNLMKFKG